MWLNKRLIWLLFPLLDGRNRTVYPQRGDELNATRNARLNVHFANTRVAPLLSGMRFNRGHVADWSTHRVLSLDFESGATLPRESYWVFAAA